MEFYNISNILCIYLTLYVIDLLYTIDYIYSHNFYNHMKNLIHKDHVILLASIFYKSSTVQRTYFSITITRKFLGAFYDYQLIMIKAIPGSIFVSIILLVNKSD